MLVLAYQGKKGAFIIKSMKNRFRNLLPQCIVPKVVFTGSKLSSKFQVKDRTIFSHNHDIIYHGNCPENGCHENYIGELPEEFQKGCSTTLKKISITIFINTLSSKVIKL